MKLVIDNKKFKELIVEKNTEKKYTILLVDDEALNRESISRILEDEYKVIKIGSGEEALEKITTDPDFPEIHIIISDQRMPNMTGVEFLEKTIPLMPKTIRIILTGYIDVKEIISAVNNGHIYNFLIKPIEPSELLVSVKRALETYELEMLNVNLIEQLRQMNNELEKKVIERTEELEIAKQKAESANKAKSDFLANMSHEIRTPMNSIIGFSDLMYEDEKDKEKKEFLSYILESGKSLLKLINDILDLSKIEAGKMEVEYSPVSFRNLFDEVTQMFSQRIKEKRLNFIVEIPDNLPKAFLLDESRLRQILVNLIGNAIKFTFEGYIKIGIKIPDESALEKTKQPDLNIFVEDTGIGISLEDQESIFEAFTQIKGKNNYSLSGTGLGLTITKRFVEMMDGKISLESSPGKGTRFDLLFRNVKVENLEYEENRESAESKTEYIKFKKSRILIADNHKNDRELIKQFMSGYDFELIETVDGLQTMEYIKRYLPDLVLLDMRIPELSGIEIAAIAKKDEQLKNIPLIAVTALALTEDEEKIRAVCDSYLKKPFTKAELFGEMKKFIGEK